MPQQTRGKAARRGRPLRQPDAAAVETGSLILDHAEALFALHGFHGVTVREVARAANVDPALVHYYFDTKQRLFDAVFDRRAAILNDERMRSMDEYERTAGEAMTVEGCVQAFLEPIWVRSYPNDPHWNNYFRIIALVNNTPEWGGGMMTKHFDPVVNRLVGLVRKCLPRAADADLYWGYHFLSGALTLSLSRTGRIDRLSQGACASDDMHANLRRLVPFVAAGFRRICQPEGSGG